MKQIKNTIKTDLAWKRLYNRLDADGLVPKKSERTTLIRIKPVYYKWTAAIAVVAISFATLFFTTLRRDSEQKDLLTIQNKKGAITLVTTLEDGSIVYLSDNAKLNYPSRFDNNRREVYLEGDALFDVSGNKERPFLINTQDIQVEVLGTSFYIQDGGNNKFELAVRRGVVRVKQKKNGLETLVQAGETVRLISGSLHLNPTKNKDVFDSFTRKIQFKDESIGNILQVINKEFDKITLETTPELSKRPLTVTFSNNSPERVAQLICLALDLKYTEKEGVYLITDTGQ
ncbi:MAG: FecR domain-containing protein [Massilibacteroides sp.]|nr:FecR domain-containing protein [Massilibacteroides sp.]MDD3061350.1 FecR domain-containing protein [Massilibacteroides sp.]MDD4114646.1 FecR domain-containing protein [Massilibacteroides sp.]MDD4659441.1 FecR domain-containing protein [Massilibacteroides sp.]